MADVPAFPVADWESGNVVCRQGSVTEQPGDRSAHPELPWPAQPGFHSKRNISTFQICNL